MWRHSIDPRPGWQERVETLGLVYPMTDMDDGTKRPYWNESAWYEIAMWEVEAMESATEELYGMCLEAANYMAKKFTDKQLFLPAGSMELVRKSLARKDKSIYARFDLTWSGDHPKMLEINGDTPTGLVESAVIQWDWLEQVMPEGDQWNSVHDRLVKWWGENYAPKSRIHFVSTEQEDSGEEEMTTTYMRDTADIAGMTTFGHAIEAVGWDKEDKQFVDFSSHTIERCFKLYPWEDMLGEEFGEYILNREEKKPVEWIEPAWKMLLSTKAILPVLWEMYPDHPNLLPAYLDGPRDLEQWVAKPLQGREGDNVVIHYGGFTPDLTHEGKYGDQPMVYQQYVELPNFDENFVVIGSWVIDGVSAGCLFRESDGPVTDYYSRVVPHALPEDARPSEEQVQQWLNE